MFDEEGALRLAAERAETAFAALNERSTVQQVIDALNLSVINFATDSAEIPERNRALLGRAANILRTAPADTRLEVGGHTDNQGDDNSNQELSNRRAVAVRDELLRLGVPTNFLTARGYGETAPKATNDTAEGRFQNRRIEYTISTGGTTTAVTNSNTTIKTTTNTNVAR